MEMESFNKCADLRDHKYCPLKGKDVKECPFRSKVKPFSATCRNEELIQQVTEECFQWGEK
jgi:hypothetical protein